MWRYHGDDAVLLFVSLPILWSHLSAATKNFKEYPEADRPGHIQGNSEADETLILNILIHTLFCIKVKLKY